MNTKGNIVPTLCPKGCGRSFANKGIASNHAKGCAGVMQPSCITTGKGDTPPSDKPTAAKVPTPVQETPVQLDALEEVCKALRDGLDLDTACAATGADPEPIYASIKRARLKDPKCTDDDREVLKKTKQASAVFLRDLMNRLNTPDEEKNKGDVAAAKALYDSVKQRMNKSGLENAYGFSALLPVIRKNTTPEGYRKILEEFSELDQDLVINRLDESLLP